MDIVIKTVPKVKKCCKGRNYKPLQEKIILQGVSGTVKPGQFLSIIGASGNS